MPAPDGDQTGGLRFRRTWTGKLILQVEAKKLRDTALGGNVTVWRDAEEDDLYRARHMRKARNLEPLV